MFALYGRSEGPPAPTQRPQYSGRFAALYAYMYCHNNKTVCSVYGRSGPACSCLSGTAGRVRREVAMAAKSFPSPPPRLQDVRDKDLYWASAIATWPPLQPCIGGGDSAACACFSFPCGPAVWSGRLTPSPPRTYSAVLLVELDTQTPCGWWLTVRSTFFTDGRW